MNSTDNSACPEREPSLQAYLFGELEGESGVELERHLEECAACRHALAEARQGLAALEELEETPLPYYEPGPVAARTAGAGEAWTAFLKRMRTGASGAATSDLRRRNPFALGAVAAAASLIVGVGLGLWVFQPGRVQPSFSADELIAEGGGLGVDREAVDALARAEFLADLALPYVNGVLGMWSEIMALEPERVVMGKLGQTRTCARELIRDGRLLRRGLDPDRDEVFLSVIGRVELFLEEVAALGDEAETTLNLLLLQETLRGSRLGDRLVALDVNSALVTALEASGWIGEEHELSMELRR